MAIYHLSVKVGSAGSGRAHFDYISRDGKYKKSGNELKEDLIHCESKNMPYWIKTERSFWKEEEKKKDGYKKLEIALPVEMSHEENIELARKFLEKEFGRDYVYSFAIHENTGVLSGEKNPHVHVMFSERKIDYNREVSKEDWFKRGGKKKDGTITGGYRKDRKFQKQSGSDWVVQIRNRWENELNNALEERGLHERVSALSLEAQGVDRIAQIHIGVDGSRMKERSDRYKQNQEIVLINERYKSVKNSVEQSNSRQLMLQRDVDKATEEVKQLEGEIIAFKRNEEAKRQREALERQAKQAEEAKRQSEAEARRLAEKSRKIEQKQAKENELELFIRENMQTEDLYAYKGAIFQKEGGLFGKYVEKPFTGLVVKDKKLTFGVVKEENKTVDGKYKAVKACDYEEARQIIDKIRKERGEDKPSGVILDDKRSNELSRGRSR